MTEDTSPENLRKFLESDDPALVRMGLSMAKVAGLQGFEPWIFWLEARRPSRLGYRPCFSCKRGCI